MSRFVASSVCLLLAVIAGFASAAACPSCIDRARVNRTCGWTGDAKFPVDAQNPEHQKHLVADAQLAEDLAIRYADAEFNRLYGYEAHGGLIDRGRVRNECMASLVTAIENNHAVTPEQIAIARGQRDWVFDAAAALSFVPLFVFAAAVQCRHLHRRFSADERVVRFAATGLAAAATSFLALQLGQLWLGLWEAIRVRNGHMSSFRAATWNPWPHRYGVALFVGGILAFWLIAASWRRAPRDLTRNAAMFACTMLGAMFVDVFVQHAIGYAFALAVLLGMIVAVLAVERFGASKPRAD